MACQNGGIIGKYRSVAFAAIHAHDELAGRFSMGCDDTSRAVVASGV